MAAPASVKHRMATASREVSPSSAFAPVRRLISTASTPKAIMPTTVTEDSSPSSPSCRLALLVINSTVRVISGM